MSAGSSGAAEPPKAGSRWTLWLPLVLFGGFVVLVLFGLLRPASRDISSAMIGKPLPAFELSAASGERPGLKTADFSGKPKLLNIFASWCVPCAAESPVLLQLKAEGVAIEGIAIRDRRDQLEMFLARNGNPYERIGADDVSAVQIAIGSSGVPESFVVDGKGVIRYQHIGEIRPDQIPLILAKLKEAEQ